MAIGDVENILGMELVKNVIKNMRNWILKILKILDDILDFLAKEDRPIKKNKT